MKSTVLRVVIVSAVCCAVVFQARAQQSEAPLTNAAVVKLVRAGFKEKTVIAIIHNRPNRFNLDPDRLIELKRSGVSENIILAMLSLGEPLLADDDWMDDSTFGGGTSRAGDAKPNGQAGGVDIFGNNSGSR